MEKEIKIKTKDGALIYGGLTISNKRSNKLIIFVHGFIGHRNEHIFFNGARYFNKKGFDVFRFDLYSGEKGARHFRDVYISQHGKDVTEIVRFFRKKYKKIYLIGHSFGGTSLLFTDTSLINALVFWDATYINWRNEKKDFRFDRRLRKHTIDWGVTHIVGDKFIDELKMFPNGEKLVSQIHKPIKFITAGKKGNEKAGKRYFAKANHPKSLVNIKEADHNFNNFTAEEKLFAETYKWLERY